MRGARFVRRGEKKVVQGLKVQTQISPRVKMNWGKLLFIKKRKFETNLNYYYEDQKCLGSVLAVSSSVFA